MISTTFVKVGNDFLGTIFHFCNYFGTMVSRVGRQTLVGGSRLHFNEVGIGVRRLYVRFCIRGANKVPTRRS